MRKFQIILSLLTISLASVWALPGSARIIGGEDVDIAKHPHLVSIRYRTAEDGPYMHQCAGSIYTDRVIITAAQCVHKIGANDRVMVVAGATTRTGVDGLPYPVSKWIAHPDYSSWTVDYDIGILILEDRLDMQHFAVGSLQIREQRPIEGKIATVAGWGYRKEFGPSSYTLEEVEVPIVSETECKRAYGASEVTERMICAGYLRSGGKDACQGDSGGPLVYNNQLIGLVSWGRGCGRPGYPSVYTFVGNLKKWVDDTIASNV